MTRVMQVMAGAEHGGAESFFMRLVPALSRDGIEQRVFLRRNAARRKALEREDVPTQELAFGGLLDLSTGPALRRAAQAWQPDVILAWMSRAARFCPAPASQGGARQDGGWKLVGRLGGYYDLKYYRRCDHLVGNTPDIVDYIRREGWPEDRVSYLPNFVDGLIAPPLDRAAFDTPATAPLVLGLGRLHGNKGFDVGLAAIAQLPGIYYWIAGEGPEREALRQRAEALGIRDRVRFLGWREDVASLFATADILLSAARHEPLGNVIIEAWANSTPVVAAAAQGPRHLIGDEETGLLVPLEDADAMAAALRRVLDSPPLAAELGAAGNARFRHEFSEHVVVERYREFFERVAR